MLLGKALTSYFKKSLDKSSSLSPLDVELIFSYVLKCRREDLYTRWDTKCSLEVLEKCQLLIAQRNTGFPIAYILKKQEFYNHSFNILLQVFIPRLETETLITAVCSTLSNQLDKKLTIIDFGCGCGCIGLSLLKIFSKASLIGVDTNQLAIQLSKKNAQNLGLSNRALFINQAVEDLFLSNEGEGEGIFKTPVQLVVANPPYIAFNDPLVEQSVVSFEPPKALFSPHEGFGHIQNWLKKASEILAPKGYYFFEVGNRQAQKLHNNLLKDLVWKRAFKDLSNCSRVMSFQKK